MISKPACLILRNTCCMSTVSIGITLKLIRFWKASIRCALWKLMFIAVDCRPRWITLGHSFGLPFCSSGSMHQRRETWDSLAMWWSSGKFVLTYRISETMYVAWIRMIFLTFHLAVSIYTRMYIYMYIYIHIYIYPHIQGVPGEMDKTSGEYPLCQSIPI